jgi:hypothetical protein
VADEEIKVVATFDASLLEGGAKDAADALKKVAKEAEKTDRALHDAGKEAEDASRKIGGMEAPAGAVSRAMRDLGTRLATVFGAGAIAANLKSVIDQMDAMGKAADRLGTKTKDLGQLYGVTVTREAARSAGAFNDALMRIGIAWNGLFVSFVSSGALDSIADGLRFVTDNMGLLAKGAELVAVVAATRLIPKLWETGGPLAALSSGAGIATIAARGLAGALALVGGPIGLLVGAVSGIIIFRKEIMQALDKVEIFGVSGGDIIRGFGAKAVEIFGSIYDAAKDIFGKISDVVQILGDFFGDFFTDAASGASGLWEVMGTAFSNIFNVASKLGGYFLEQLQPALVFIYDTFDWLGKKIAEFAPLIVDGVAGAFKFLVQVAWASLTAITELTKKVMADMAKAITDMNNFFAESWMGQQMGLEPAKLDPEQAALAGQTYMQAFLSGANKGFDDVDGLFSDIFGALNGSKEDEEDPEDDPMYKAGKDAGTKYTEGLAAGLGSIGKITEKNDEFNKDIKMSNADMLKATTANLASAFQDNKAFGIASAVINTAQGITEALKETPPLSYAYAATTAAMGAAQIAAIRSAQPGSSAGAPGSAATATQATQAQAAAPPIQRVAIDFQGPDSARMGMQELIDTLNEAGKRGMRVEGVLA